jgi:hypothetical protein
MGLPRGRTIPLSPMRRLMCDFLHLTRHTAMVAIERPVVMRDLIEARSRLESRPSWPAMFIKAYAMVAEQHVTLRRSYLSFPTARLYEHACSVAHVAISRQIEGEDVVLGLLIQYPERLRLLEIDDRIRRAQTGALTELADFRRLLGLAPLPGPFRRLALWSGLSTSGYLRARFFGTFGLTSIAALGSSPLHLLTPLTSTLTYGVFAADGSLQIRLFFDHRVLDGMLAAAALKDLEAILHGPIAEELRGLA